MRSQQNVVFGCVRQTLNQRNFSLHDLLRHLAELQQTLRYVVDQRIRLLLERLRQILEPLNRFLDRLANRRDQLEHRRLDQILHLRSKLLEPSLCRFDRIRDVRDGLFVEGFSCFNQRIRRRFDRLFASLEVVRDLLRDRIHQQLLQLAERLRDRLTLLLDARRNARRHLHRLHRQLRRQTRDLRNDLNPLSLNLRLQERRLHLEFLDQLFPLRLRLRLDLLDRRFTLRPNFRNDRRVLRIPSTNEVSMRVVVPFGAFLRQIPHDLVRVEVQISLQRFDLRIHLAAEFLDRRKHRILHRLKDLVTLALERIQQIVGRFLYVFERSERQIANLFEQLIEQPIQVRLDSPNEDKPVVDDLVDGAQNREQRFVEQRGRTRHEISSELCDLVQRLLNGIVDLRENVLRALIDAIGHFANRPMHLADRLFDRRVCLVNQRRQRVAGLINRVLRGPPQFADDDIDIRGEFFFRAIVIGNFRQRLLELRAYVRANLFDLFVNLPPNVPELLRDRVGLLFDLIEHLVGLLFGHSSNFVDLLFRFARRALDLIAGRLDDRVFLFFQLPFDVIDDRVEFFFRSFDRVFAHFLEFGRDALQLRFGLFDRCIDTAGDLVLRLEQRFVDRDDLIFSFADDRVGRVPDRRNALGDRNFRFVDLLGGEFAEFARNALGCSGARFSRHADTPRGLSDVAGERSPSDRAPACTLAEVFR